MLVFSPTHSHHGMFWRAHVQADDIADLVDELRILGEFERVGQPWLPARSAPPTTVRSPPSRRDHASTNVSRRWIAAWNDNLKPFVWHKTGDQILDSLK